MTCGRLRRRKCSDVGFSICDAAASGGAELCDAWAQLDSRRANPWNEADDPSMQFVQRPTVRIDLARVRNAAQAIAHRTGVPVIAVMKADAYGLGAREVVEALRDVPNVAGFYCFSLREAV